MRTRPFRWLTTCDTRGQAAPPDLLRLRVIGPPLEGAGSRRQSRPRRSSGSSGTEAAKGERALNTRQQLLDDVRCEGPIPRLLQEARLAVYDRVPTRQALGADGRFQPVGLIPTDAWLEGLVNAVVHRSYSLMGDHVRVEIFGDRLEIERSPSRIPAPGGLPEPAENHPRGGARQHGRSGRNPTDVAARRDSPPAGARRGWSRRVGRQKRFYLSRTPTSPRGCPR